MTLIDRKFMRLRRTPAPPARFTLVATAKNEGPYLLEWVAYHRSIGFDNIIIFQNDSEDFTGKILTCLDEIGAVRYRYNAAKRGGHQIAAYNRSVRHAEYQSADWVMALDLDEFLVIKTGDGTLPALLSAAPKFHRMLINWKLFGSSGIDTIQSGLVTDRYSLAEKDNFITKHVQPYKTLFKRDAFLRPGVHKPSNFLLEEDMITVNGSGLGDDAFEIRNFQSTDPGLRSLAQVNHYIVKDPQSFVLKSAKGSAHQANRDIGETYWARRNKNHEADHSIRANRPRLIREMKRLNNLSGGRLRALTDQAVAYHREKFATVRSDPDYAKLYDYCATRSGVKPPEPRRISNFPIKGVQLTTGVKKSDYGGFRILNIKGRRAY
ncbi:glycosyltransferase family 2 protein [Neptunicoccus sediminis]|uniref:glycosyltransferase family 2 protein n=1 Tax=Neptunicoccus sediminis TaxID=1892596 RepID=UPI0008461C99|nr:glycosyltransferase family 2 protein [Neptunicoccus sediminis]